MLETFRHLVETDAFDLFVMTGDRAYDADAGSMSFAELREVMERAGPGWTGLVSGPLDPDAVVLEVDEKDGFQRWAPVGSGWRAPWSTPQTIAARSVRP